MALKDLFAGFDRRRVYLDHASAPIPDKRIFDAMHAVEHIFGNPSSPHAEGREAKQCLDAARATIAGLLAVKREEIIFTSGGTESNNLAIRGTVEGLIRAGAAYSDIHILTSAIEHPSVADVVLQCQKLGVRVTILPVSKEGHVDVAYAVSQLTPAKTLVSIAYVNGEIGVVEPIRKIAMALREKKKEIGGDLYVHTDASQAGLYFDLTAHTLGVDLMTLDALKLRGPKGSGMLFAKLMTPLVSVLYGGGQERGLRPGTENTVAAHGMAESLRHAVQHRRVRSDTVEALRDYGIHALMRAFPTMQIHGDRKNRSPNNIHVSFPKVDGEYLAVILDTHGIACSTRSACLGLDGTGSHVVRELGGTEEQAHGAIRFTLAEVTQKRDMDFLVQRLLKAIPIATKS